MDEIDKLLAKAQKPGPTKTYSELFQAGVPQKGGLKQLASAEKTGAVFGSRAAPSNSGDSQEGDLLVRWMKGEGIPVTREKYLALAYPDGLPEEWTAELEAQLPQELQQPFPK